MIAKKIKTGLYIGRFQPFHKGHLSAIQQALNEVDRLIIGVGSAQYDHTPENPFTAEERKNMLEIGLKEAGLEAQCEIYLIPDIHNEAKWVEHVENLVPAFDQVFVGNEGIVRQLFAQAGYPVHRVKQELPLSATQIRENMKKNGVEWREWLTPSVAQYLTEIQAIKRVNSL